ncbi:MAG: CvpA family protein [Bacteroidetes bacterium]|nr:CvpA family protein [Bacteroidota bacterium]
METLDIIILLPLAYFGFKGYQSGLIKEVLGILGLILAVFLTINYLDQFSSYAKNLLNLQDDFNPFIFGIMLFVTVMVVVNLITYIASKLIDVTKLTFVDKLLGLAFGLLKAGLLISALLILISGFGYPSDETKKASISYDYLIKVAPTTYNAIALVYPGAEDFSKTIKKTINENNPLNSINF